MEKYEIKGRNRPYRLDIVSCRWGICNQEEGSIEITHGYSRDHRPDLKQFMMNLICVGDGDIPVMMEVVSGNQADKARLQDYCKNSSNSGHLREYA
jgi:transposase